jgi:hypothetical protein
MESIQVQALIKAGSDVAVHIKKLIYPSQPWDADVALTIAAQLTMLKKRGRMAFPNLNEFQLMNKFLEFNAQDLLDVFEVYQKSA